MDRKELERVIAYYNKEGYMHPNDIDRLIELAKQGIKCCGEDCCEGKDSNQILT